MIDYYDVLGIGETAFEAEIKDSYRRLVHLSHPDKGGSPALFRLVQEAYEVLSNPSARRAYDAERSGAHPSTDQHARAPSGHDRKQQEQAEARREQQRQARARQDAEERERQERERQERARLQQEREQRKLVLQLLADNLLQLLDHRRLQFQRRRDAQFPIPASMIRPPSHHCDERSPNRTQAPADQSRGTASSERQVVLSGCFAAFFLLLV